MRSQGPGLNLDNIQGNILSGFQRKTESFYFFQITDAKLFRKQLGAFIPLVKTVAQVLKDRKAVRDHKQNGKETLLTLVGVNIAFSHQGFVKLGIDDSNLSNDKSFQTGQRADAVNLKDKGTTTGGTFVPDWEPAFLQDIHAVILIAGDSHLTVNNKLNQIRDIFGVGSATASIKEVTTIVGDVRAGKNHAHEHFGFLDGVSNPAIIGFDKDPPPGPSPVQPGIILLGHTGDPLLTTRPSWVVDGSFLVIRYLFQRVPEFNTFLKNNPVDVPGLTKEQGSELLGARLVGRWKSGAPIDLAPFKDDPKLGADPQRNNNFQFATEGTFQKICPFAAHIRKTNPRADLIAKGINIDDSRIMRRGIQFGPEVTEEENASGKTSVGRGLIFSCYQTSITKGFAFMQESWANNPNFPHQTPEVPGLDPIIGQGVRQLTGTDPDDPKQSLTNIPDFVVPKGGEYFFSPSVKALKETLAVA